MSRDELMYLQDILESCRKVLKFTVGMSLAELVRNDKTYDAVVRNLEIIGEAAKNLPEEVREQMPDIEWRKVAGLRDVLAHAYFGIDNDILWDVVQNKVPGLVELVEDFLGGRQS